MPNPLLQIHGLQIDFVADDSIHTAIQDLSITLNRGEILAIVGESGSGKSVTSLSILQLLPVPPARYTHGTIFFSPNGDHQVNLLAQDNAYMQNIRGNEIAMIFQEPMSSLNPVFSCGEQVAEAILAHQQLTPADAKKRTIDLFEKVKLPDAESVFNRYPHQLSGGQKQRVMIAMAISSNPSLLICDEPTTALDVTVQKTILELIKSLQAEFNMGVIFITHDLGIVADLADRTAVLLKGKLVEEGPVKEVFTNPKHPYTKALLACRPSLHPKGEPLPVVSDYLDPQRAGKAATVPRRENNLIEPRELETILRAENVSVEYQGTSSLFRKNKPAFKAVDRVSFAMHAGETLGLVGESGCGKSTLGRTILRLIKPSSGKIFYKDQDIALAQGSELKKLRREIQIVFQDPYGSLNPKIPVGEAIEEVIRVHGILEDRHQRKAKVVDLLEKVDLRSDHFNRYPHEFSGGQRQRIVIARALALSPSVIVCDESVSALDVSVQAQVLNLLNDLKKEFGFSCLFISHDLSVVRYLSDRIMVMQKGKIVESGNSEDVYRNPQTDYTKRLLDSIPGLALVNTTP